MKKTGILVGLVIVLLVVGEIRCIYKAITCIGCIVGWIDIEDK